MRRSVDRTVLVRMENHVSRGTMTMTSDTERRRKQKFRSSCDSCSSSKIKCGQGRPTCARCENLGIKCNYSPSQRKGKPPGTSRESKNSSKLSQSKGKKKSQESPGEDFAHHSEEPAFNQNIPCLNTLLLDPDSLMSMQWQANSFDTDPNSAELSNGDLSSIFSHHVETHVDPMSPPTTPQVLDMGSKALRQDCQDGIFPTSMSRVAHGLRSCAEPIRTSLASKEIMTESQDCASIVALIFPTLHTLRIDSGVCSAINTGTLADPYPSTEQVLITNKAAMHSMDQILACPCSLNPQYALTLALMCHKILVRYEFIVNTMANSGTTADSDPSLAQNFAVASISVGAYKMDADDERRMMIQLVVNEIRKMKGLVDRYEEKYCAAAVGDKHQRDGIYFALEIFLRSDLKEKLKNVTNALDD